MNQRQVKLTHYLLNNHENYTTIKSLATELNCSERTIRNDLQGVEDFFLEHQISGEIIRYPGVGIRLEMTSKDKKNFVAFLMEDKEEKNYPDEVRRFYILFRFLMSKDPLTLDELSENYYVSKLIIKEDFVHLEILLKKYQLKLATKPKIGTKVIGLEKDKREVFAYVTRKINKLDIQKNNLHTFFGEKDILQVHAVLKNTELKENQIIFNDPLNSIVLHILFMLKRIKLNATVQLTEDDWLSIDETKAMLLSDEIAEQLNKTFHLVFPKNEVGYLALRLRNFDQNLRKDKSNETNIMINQMIDFLIKDVSQLFTTNLTRDERLKENIFVHLQASFTRIRSGFQISNPLTQSIKREYIQLFMVIQATIEEYLSAYKLSLPEEEIAYLTVHFQGAIERYRTNSRQNYRSIIVCHYGIGVSAFIEAKINRYFPNITINQLVVQSEVEQYVQNHAIDFILTTVPLKGLSIPTVQITPLVEQKDLDDISRYLRSSQTLKKESHIFDIMSYSNPFLVYTQQSGLNSQEILLDMGKCLIKNGNIEPEYLDSLLKREQESSTYIGNGIVLPHGNPRYVNKSSISIMTLKEPIKWGGNKVQLIILLGLEKEELRQKELKKFFSVLHTISSHEELLQKIVKEQDKIKLLTHFSRYDA